MATAQVQQVTTALLEKCPKEEQNDREVQDMAKKQVLEAPPTVEDQVAHESNKEEEAIATDQAMAQDVEAKLDIKDPEEPKEEETKKGTEKAAAAVVPVDDEPKGAVAAVPDEMPAVAPEELNEAACEETAHEE